MCTFDFEGVVHFAGITKGDAFALCREPLKYPFLLNAALPLYLSAVKSFGKSLFKETQQELATLVSLCSASLDLVLTEVKKSNIIVAYNPGPGRFIWPPR